MKFYRTVLFVCFMAASQPTLGHWQGDANFTSFNLKVTGSWESCNKVESPPLARNLLIHPPGCPPVESPHSQNF